MLLFLLCAVANDDYWSFPSQRQLHMWWLDDRDERCVPKLRPARRGLPRHCRAVRKCVLNAPCEKERCTAVPASKVYHPMALKTCVE